MGSTQTLPPTVCRKRAGGRGCGGHAPTAHRKSILAKTHSAGISFQHLAGLSAPTRPAVNGARFLEPVGDSPNAAGFGPPQEVHLHKVSPQDPFNGTQ